VITNYGLEREKIAATIDKRALARAIGITVDALVRSTETAQDDFWIGVDLNVRIEAGTAPERHARINVYVPANYPERTSGKAVPPIPEERIRIPASIAESSIARAMAWTVQTLTTAVQAEHSDFLVNIDLNVHIKRGRAYERRARINVYGDLIDSYDTTIMDIADLNTIPQEILDTFCEDLGKR
jgi:hypothetical protein